MGFQRVKTLWRVQGEEPWRGLGQGPKTLPEAQHASAGS